jgi:hypothetical protein
MQAIDWMSSPETTASARSERLPDLRIFTVE